MDGEHHPPWIDGGVTYGPETPGAYTRSLKVHAEGRAGGGLWDHEVGGGGEVTATVHLYATHDERGRRVTTVSRRSVEYVAAVRPRLDPDTLSPTELRVWADLVAGHAVEWIAGHRGMRRSTVKRIMDKLRAGGL